MKGWYDVEDKSVHIYMPNVESAEDLVETYFHEVIAHRGVRELLGENGFNEMLDVLAEKLGREEVQKAITAWSSHPERGDNDAATRREAMDEWIAYHAEKMDPGARRNVLEVIRDFFKKLFGFPSDKSAEELVNRLFRDAAEKMKRRQVPAESRQQTKVAEASQELQETKEPEQPKETEKTKQPKESAETGNEESPRARFREAERRGDVAAAAESATAFYREATPKNTTIDEVLRFREVYHNSPYLLKREDGAFVDPETGEHLGFDHRFMGSGEGAQAHGYGSYFSVRDLEDYAGDDYSRKGRELTVYIPKELKAEIEASPERDQLIEAIQEIKDLLRRRCISDVEEYPEFFLGTPSFKSKVKWIDAHMEYFCKMYVHTIRHKYVVSIPDPSPSNYLEERKRITEEQSAKIESALRDARLLDAISEEHPDWKSYRGGKIYNIITQEYLRRHKKSRTESKRKTSRLLNKAGFVGIHYFGRRDGECYVIFDENDAKIVDHVRFREGNRSRRRTRGLMGSCSSRSMGRCHRGTSIASVCQGMCS